MRQSQRKAACACRVKIRTKDGTGESTAFSLEVDSWDARTSGLSFGTVSCIAFTRITKVGY